MCVPTAFVDALLSPVKLSLDGLIHRFQSLGPRVQRTSFSVLTRPSKDGTEQASHTAPTILLSSRFLLMFGCEDTKIHLHSTYSIFEYFLLNAAGPHYSWVSIHPGATTRLQINQHSQGLHCRQGSGQSHGEPEPLCVQPHGAHPRGSSSHTALCHPQQTVSQSVYYLGLHIFNVLVIGCWFGLIGLVWF